MGNMLFITYYVIPGLLVASILIAVLYFYPGNKAAVVFVAICAAPLAVFEYFLLWWIWAWNLFNILIFVSLPITCISLLIPAVVLLRKTKDHIRLKQIVILSICTVIPLLTILIVSLLASSAGISIQMD